jgi:predicted ATPase
MPTPIVGREGEWRAIERLLDGTATGPRVLVMEGPPGIGKSSIWREALAGSEERGFRKLVSAPAETEQGLPYTGLHDLLGAIPDADIAALPEPQARALRAALYRSDPSEGTADAAAVAIAASRLLQRMAERGPLLLAVDDLQWLDASSAAVFRFCLRRLGSARVAVLICRRSGSADTAGSEIALADIVEQLTVGPLSLGALHRIVEERLGVRLARPALVRLHESTEGNPYLALELVRAYGPEGPAAMLQGAPPPEALRTAGTSHRVLAQADAPTPGGHGAAGPAPTIPPATPDGRGRHDRRDGRQPGSRGARRPAPR